AVDTRVEGRLHHLVAVDERDVLDLAAGDELPHLRGLDLVVPAAGREVLQGQEHADDGDHDPQPGTLEQSLHKTLSGTPRRSTRGNSSEGTTVPPVHNHHS